MKAFHSLMRGCVILSFGVWGVGCAGQVNPRPDLPSASDAGLFFTTPDGLRLQSVKLHPERQGSTVYVAPGITGMDVRQDRDVLELLAGRDRRVVVIFPRGTGYSDGVRGDLPSLDVFVNDFKAGIAEDERVRPVGNRIFLYGHSMSCAVALAAAATLEQVEGILLVNPPYRRKPSPGMSPTWWEYVRYAAYYLFAPRTPIVNMAGDPERMLDPQERAEALARYQNPALVKYFSLRMMTGVQALMESMPEKARPQRAPLLLIYGEKDSVVERRGCEEIFSAWGAPAKEFWSVPGGGHGKETVLLAHEKIEQWMADRAGRP